MNTLDIALKKLKDAEKLYIIACKEYKTSDTDGAFLEVVKTEKAYADAHIEYSVEYSKAIGS